MALPCGLLPTLIFIIWSSCQLSSCNFPASQLLQAYFHLGVILYLHSVFLSEFWVVMGRDLSAFAHKDNISTLSVWLTVRSEWVHDDQLNEWIEVMLSYLSGYMRKYGLEFLRGQVFFFCLWKVYSLLNPFFSLKLKTFIHIVLIGTQWGSLMFQLSSTFESPAMQCEDKMTMWLPHSAQGPSIVLLVC